jgi:uncharacterized protein with HEPN domain
MDRKAAKELVHIRGWLERVNEITQRGKRAYLADALLQEAGDSLMMKLGEAANRLSRLNVLAPDGVKWALAVANRNFIIHQVRRDQPRTDLAHALARSSGMEVILSGAVRGSLDHDPRRLRLTTPATSARTRRHAATRRFR